MLSGFHRREELASPAFYQAQTNVGTLNTAEAMVGSCPAPSALGALQNMVGSFYIPTSNAQGFGPTHSMDKSARLSPEQQKRLPQGHWSKSPSDVVNASRGDDGKQSCPGLYQFLASDNDSSPSQLSEGTLQPSDNTPSSSTAGSKKYLSDDEILNLIENKLQKFRVQMKELKKRSSTDVDSLNSNFSSHQGSTCTTPAPGEPEKAPENNMAIRKKKRSNCGWPGPEGPQMMSAPTAKNSTEYVRTMRETADVCRKEEDNPMGQKALSGSSLAELVKHFPSVSVHHKPSTQDDGSPWRNDNPDLDIGNGNILPSKTRMKKTDIVPGIVDSSILSEKTSKSLKTSNQQPSFTDNQTSHPFKMSEENRSISPAGHYSLTLHLSPNFVKSSVAHYQHVIQPEPEQKEPIQEMQEKEVQAGEGGDEMDLSSCRTEGSSILKDPKYDDVSDDENFNVMPQLAAYDGEIGVSMHSPEQNLNAPLLTLAVTPTPKQQRPEMSLACTCPYFIETDDGFEQVPCPKCADDPPPIKWEVESEDESEEVILFVTSLVVKDESIVMKSESDDQEQNVSSPDGHNQHTVVQKVPEYDSLDTFLKAHKIVLKPSVYITPEPSPFSLLQPLAVEKVASEQVLSPLDTVEKDPKSSGSSPCSDAEDSCDTEDSADYPSHTKSNYLTASNRVHAPSLQPPNVDIAEEVNRSPLEEASNRKDWFPDLSDVSSSSVSSGNHLINNASVLHKTTTRLVDDEDVQLHVSKTFRKAKSKTRSCRVIDSDSESDTDRDWSKTGRKTSSVSETSTLPDIQPSLEREKEIKPKPARLKSRAVSFDLTLNQHGSKTHSRTSSIDSIDSKVTPKPKSILKAFELDSQGQNVQSVSSKVSNDMQPESTKKQKSQTVHKSDKGEKRRPSLEVKTTGLTVNEAKAHKSHLNMSKTTKSNGLLGQPSLSNQYNKKQPEGGDSPVSGILSYHYLASNPIKPTLNTAQNPSQPTLHNSTPFTPNKVKSTSTKEALIRDWANTHVPIPEERRNCNKAARTALNPPRRDPDASKPKPPKPRKRHRSQEPQTPLMKKTKLEALQLSKAVHHKEPTVPNISRPVGEGYKWKGDRSVEDSAEDWLDQHCHG